ncbi:SIR2 family protein [Bacillus thuringiensis]|uniref:SIR2 family protein n=1 Tax=Bacillus thuringiensis TaxID=1428 RepID=UPI000BFCD689|nr:SIR2 family protein [Bacillus thuringiensis]PGV87379.1 hypothetical protein COD85_08410 [Bacillus thuringiensis]
MKRPNGKQVTQTSNIATDLINNKVVFFIGSGFSRDLGYPSWAELLKEIITENDLMKKIKDSSLFYLFSKKDHRDYEAINGLMLENLIGVDFLRLAGYVDILLRENKNKDIQSEIKKSIQRYEDTRSEKKEKIKEYRKFFAILTEYLNELITTNYDTNLEYCIDNLSVIHRNLNSINSSSNRYTKNSVKLYKIHGCINDDNNGIIITEKNYQEFSSSNKYIFNKLYSTFIENNIVFIGYSLHDPNIRELLSEVLEEIRKDKGSNKKIYWINRNTINEMDKKFYNEMYNVEIIDDIEILDFLELLGILVEMKWNAIETVREKWEESTDLLISTRTNDIEFTTIINKTIEANKFEEALNQIYQSFIKMDVNRSRSSKAFFCLLSKIPEGSLENFDREVLEILETDDDFLLSIIRLIKENTSVRELFNKKNYNLRLLDSLISRAQSVNDFGLYEAYANALIDYYIIFNRDLGNYEDEFVKAFYDNYKYLTNTKTLGYSFESLLGIKDKLKQLDEYIVIKILNLYPKSAKSKIQIEQITEIIKGISPETKGAELLYKYGYQQLYFEKLERITLNTVHSYLTKDLNYSYFSEDVFGPLDDIYTAPNSTDKVTVKEEESIVTMKYNENEIKIYIQPDYTNKTLQLFIGEEIKIFKNKDEFKHFLIEGIQASLDSWNLPRDESI